MIKRFAIVATFLALCLSAAARAEVAVVFGPGPRALDNRTLFAPAALPVWRKLKDAGVNEILLNATFLMRSELKMEAQKDRRLPARPEGTYLRDSDIRDLARLQSTLGFNVSYEAGSGLGGEICDPRLSPEERGQRAAEREYKDTIARLKAAGVWVAALNVDGPFLRMIEGSTKEGSCEWLRDGFGIDPTVRSVQAYLRAIRDLVAEANPGNLPPQMRLLINLPNWQVRNLPRRGDTSRRGSVDLVEVLHAFADLQARSRAPVHLSEIVIDYPYALVMQNPDLFRDRSKHLWNASRRLNVNRPGPSFGYITNTLSYAHACLEREPKARVPFLPYQHPNGPISEACQRAQIGIDATPNNPADSDADYLRDSLAYAQALRPKGALGRHLRVLDGTEIAGQITHVYMQSWGINPLRNLWLAEALADQLPRRR